MAIPIISDLLERLFGPVEDPHSRDDVKRRLQVVLAHDRLALDPQTLEMMRQEIIAVVSRYVEVDFESLEFSLATNERVTALTANLPIRRIRPLGRGADKPINAEQEVERIELASPAEALALDAKETEAALKQFAEDNRDAHPYLDIDRSGLDEEGLDEEGLNERSKDDSSEQSGRIAEESFEEMGVLDEVGFVEPPLSSATSLPSDLPSDEADALEPDVSDLDVSDLEVSDLSEPDMSESSTFEVPDMSEPDMSESSMHESSMFEVPDMSIPDASVQSVRKRSPNRGQI